MPPVSAIEEQRELRDLARDRSPRLFHMIASADRLAARMGGRFVLDRGRLLASLDAEKN